MKQFAIFFLVLSITSGCKKLDDLLTFAITDETTFTLENASPLDLPFEVQTPDITTNSSQEFRNNNTRADLVKDVRLEEVKLTLVSPSGKTFSFLKSIQIFISTDGNDEIVLASRNDISSTASTLDLETTNEKLDAYVKASSYKLRTSVITRETLTQDIDIKMNLKFKVTADAL